MRWNFTHISGSSGVSEPLLACVKRLDDIRTVTVWNYIVGAPVRHLWDWSAEEKWRTDFGAFLQIWTRFFFFFKCLFLTWYIFRLWRDLNCFKTFFFFFFGSTENCFSLFHIYSNKSEKWEKVRLILYQKQNKQQNVFYVFFSMLNFQYSKCIINTETAFPL